jgi:hypothetical protein
MLVFYIPLCPSHMLVFYIPPCPSRMLVFYISLCWRAFPAWRNVKCEYQHGRGTKYSGTNRRISHFQNCNFPEECFSLVSFRYSVYSYSTVEVKQLMNCSLSFRLFSRTRRSENVTGTSSEAKNYLHSDWSMLAVRACL